MTPQSVTARSMPGWTLLLTSVAFMMTGLDALVVMTALPAIRDELHARVSTLEWTVNAYTLTCAAGIITAAALGDRLGRRRVFLFGLTLFTAASAVCAVAPNAGLLIAARAVQGLGAAVVFPLSLTLLIQAYPPARRGRVVGIWGGLGALAAAGGPLVGGAVTEGLDWHWIFWVNVPIGVVTILAGRRLLQESYGDRPSLDLPAVALVSAASTALVAGLIRAAEHGFGEPVTVALLMAGVVCGAGFLLWESRVAEPMLPPALFRNRTFSAATATALLMGAALYSAVFLITQWFQLARGASPLGTGLRVLPWTAVPMVLAPLAGRLSDRIGTRPVMATGMLLQGLGLGWLALVGTTGASYATLVAPLFVAGVGIAMVVPTVPATIMGAVPPRHLGKASGVNSTLQRFGTAFGIAAAAAVFSAHGGLGTPAQFTAGFRPALGFSAALSLAGVLTALAVGRRVPPPVPAPAPVPTGVAEELAAPELATR